MYLFKILGLLIGKMLKKVYLLPLPTLVRKQLNLPENQALY